MGAISIQKEISGEIQIRVGQRSQQTVEVCPREGGAHLAACHTAAYCHPLWPLNHLLCPLVERRQDSIRYLNILLMGEHNC